MLTEFRHRQVLVDAQESEELRRKKLRGKIFSFFVCSTRRLHGNGPRFAANRQGSATTLENRMKVFFPKTSARETPARGENGKQGASRVPKRQNADSSGSSLNGTCSGKRERGDRALAAVVPSICRDVGSGHRQRGRWNDLALSGLIVVSSDAEALHFGLQGSAFQSETLCSPILTRDDAVGFREDSDDVLPFSIVEGVVLAIGTAVLGLDFFQRNPQHS